MQAAVHHMNRIIGDEEVGDVSGIGLYLPVLVFRSRVSPPHLLLRALLCSAIRCVEVLLLEIELSSF